MSFVHIKGGKDGKDGSIPMRFDTNMTRHGVETNLWEAASCMPSARSQLQRDCGSVYDAVKSFLADSHNQGLAVY